ncbi:MAG: MlaD family protein [Candidatus Omnitrophica bacterium]|nr:MlaD family protein [Candidatus Omnitrophota bacterium]
MYRDEKLEVKVGIFIGVGMFLMFLIVFSIKDFYIFEKGYNIKVVFDYVNGIGTDSPVRLAGVHVGEVKDVGIYYDSEVEQTRVKLDVWIRENVKIEKDSIARVNTLGLLGEQYLEIAPGKENRFLSEGDQLVGKNPMNVGQQVEKMNEFFASASGIIKKIESGEGTLGKLLTDDTLYNEMTAILLKLSGGEGTLGKLLTDDALYNDLESVFAGLKEGRGTVGKLLTDETIYNDMEEFVADLKANPWKLLHKPSGSSRK